MPHRGHQGEVWAQKHRTDDALFEAFQHYQPIGMCSMDTTGKDTARVYAELAYARGDLGRFLHLQVNIMGDQFPRVASSSFGDAAHPTEAQRLLRTGIDLEPFFLGLLRKTSASARTSKTRTCSCRPSPPTG